jgi:hypothetical protein
MTAGSMKALKVTGLVALLAVCCILVYRNLIAPAGETFSARVPAAVAAGDPENSGTREPAPLTAAANASGGRDKAMDPRQLAALDPTLRVDLLERVAKIKYEGGTRNIFQFYTPPPKPIANPMVTAAPPVPVAPVVPPPPTAPLKFYGVATPRGSSQKKAFLSDGDEIFIGMEGDVVDKHYKITRIGVNALEWEDTQNHQKGQLPLIQE